MESPCIPHQDRLSLGLPLLRRCRFPFRFRLVILLIFPSLPLRPLTLPRPIPRLFRFRPLLPTATRRLALHFRLLALIFLTLRLILLLFLGLGLGCSLFRLVLAPCRVLVSSTLRLVLFAQLCSLISINETRLTWSHSDLPSGPLAFAGSILIGLILYFCNKDTLARQTNGKLVHNVRLTLFDLLSELRIGRFSFG